MDHAVGLLRLDQFAHVLQPRWVGGEDGAINLQVALGNGVEQLVHRGALLFYHPAEAAAAHARLLADHHRPRRLDHRRQLPVGDVHRAAREQQPRPQPRPLVIMYARARSRPLGQLVAKFVHHRDKTLGVIEERKLRDEQRVHARDWRGRGGPEAVEPVQGLAFLVGQPDAPAQALHRHLFAGQVFERSPEPVVLEAHQLAARKGLSLGQVHGVEVFNERPKLLPGLFLAVTGVLPHDQVGSFHIRTDFGELEAEGALDQIAGIARQVLLG